MLGAISSLKGSSSGYKIPNSLRLRASNSAYLTRTPSVAGSQTTWTWSGWIKTSNFSGIIFNGGSVVNGVSGNYTAISIGETINFFHYNGTINNLNVATKAVYRDPSAWYHLVVSVNTTLATSTDRVKIYINGILQSASATTTYPTLNFSTAVNSTLQHRIGSRVSDGFGGTSWNYFDGYLTEVNFIDGQALDVSSFGAINNTTGVWAPKAYSGTYGTNGFYLKFADASGATATTIGKDSSGHSNNWTPSGISVTAGTSYDSMIDTPTPYSDGTVRGRGNYATLNPVDILNTTSTSSDGNLSTSSGTSGNLGKRGTISVNSGKWYWEVAIVSGSEWYIGISRIESASDGILGNTIGGQTDAYSYGMSSSSAKLNGTIVPYGTTFGVNDIIGVALNLDNSRLEFYKNGVSQGVAFSSGVVGNFVPAFSDGSNTSSSSVTFNFGQRPFAYTPPAGFLALNTQNLPVPTIRNGALYTAATTYTGTGASRSISNTVNNKSFQPDLVWIKGRSGATDHALYDSVRGAQKDLVSNTTAAETTQTTGLLSFDAAGATIGALAKLNTNAATYVAWQWKAGGTTVSNTAGTITSQVNAGADQGFSIVSYTGTGVNATVGHGLGVAPKMIITKDRDTVVNWVVYHESMGGTSFARFNTTDAKATDATIYNGIPSSTVFNIGSGSGINGSGKRMVSYCFAEIAGYSKFGSYTGNSSADGPFIYCNFRPKFVMIKEYTGSPSLQSNCHWVICDTSRDTYNVATNSSVVDSAGADLAIATLAIDILSNGFKIRLNPADAINSSSCSYIFAAFAENPSKYALAR